MTAYEHFHSERRRDQALLDAFTQPLALAAIKVDTKRPSYHGLVSLRFPAGTAVHQDVGQLADRADRIRQQMALSRQPQDRGS